MENNVNKFRRVKCGDIIWVDLKGNGCEQQRARPCLVVSNNANNIFSSTVDIIPFTSREKIELPIHVWIEKSEENGLKVDSILLVEQKRTVDRHFVTGKIGKLEEKYHKDIALAMMIQMPMLQCVLNNLDDDTIKELQKYAI